MAVSRRRAVFFVLIWMLASCGTAVPPSESPPPTPIMPVELAVETAVPPSPTATDPPTSTIYPTADPVTATSPPTATPTLRPSPTPTPIPDTGWERLRPGLERRVIRLRSDGGGPAGRLFLLRLEPEQFRFAVAYRPGEPQTLVEWQAETGALIVVNGGFFTSADTATGLMVVDGQASGVSYGDFGGMLAITADTVSVRWLRERPYDPAEPLLYGLQSFPMLVRPGGEMGFPEEDGKLARRTVVAQDGNGRVLFILAPDGRITLHQMSRWLVASDLNLDVALNLDGGPSTGLLLADPEDGAPAFVPLPAVITVHMRP